MTKKRSLPRIISPSVKIVNKTDKATTFRVVGIPFGGPEFLDGKDLHGQYFDRAQTNYGKDADGNVIVKTIYAYYDHALNDRVGKDLIGFANYYAETDEGQVWDIEVMRAYRYHDMLLTLAEKNLLGASSQPVQTAVEIDWDSGLIKSWPPAEISLTPTPANPDAVVEVLKSFNLKFEETETEEEEEETPNLEDVVGDVSNDIDEMFNEEEEDSSSEDIAKAVLPKIEELLTEIKKLTDSVNTFATKNAEEHKTLVNGMSKMTNGLKSFAGHVATRLKLNVEDVAKDLDKKSEEELDAEDELRETSRRMKSGVPAHAPGRAK
jgi:hypothetical protein